MGAKTLHLTLKKVWFDMILSGEKKEEYREIKPYWIKRLCPNDYDLTLFESIIPDNDKNPTFSCKKFKEYDTITFKNGYAADSPEMIVELQGIQIEMGLASWGAELGKKYFVLSLGKKLSTKNLKP